MERRRSDPDRLKAIRFAIVAAFVALATLSSLVFPIFEGPDEYSHFQYARLLAQGRGLPLQTDADRRSYSEGFNPPLYYLATGAVLALADPADGAGIAVPPRLSEPEMVRLAESWTGLPPLNPDFYYWGRGQELNFFAHPSGRPIASAPLLYVNLMRLVSVVCGVVTLIGVVLLMREALPGSPLGQLAGLIVVAFNPQFVYLSSALNSDNLVTAFATLALWRLAALLRAERTSPRDAVVLGVLLGLGTLAKTNMLFLAVPTAVVVVRRTVDLRTAANRLALIGAVMTALAGWFFVRNALVYDGDFLGWHTRATLQPQFVIEAVLRRYFVGFVIHGLLPTVWTSFWGVFGWMSIRLHDWQYTAYGVLSAVALASLVGAWRARSDPPGPAIVLAWSCLALNLASLVAFNRTFLADQGRLVFPSIGAVALLIGAGLDTLWQPLPERFRQVTVGALATGMLGSILYAFVVIVRPVYFPG